MASIQRRTSVTCTIGTVRVGSDAPVVVQSMTNTDTADVASTVEQVTSLARAGSELVRVTVNNEDAAAAVPHIVEQLDNRGIHHHRRLSLQRTPASKKISRLRSGAGEVSHQSRQRQCRAKR